MMINYLEEQEFQIEFQEVAEDDLLPDEGHVDLDWQEVLVDHGDQVVLESENPVVDVKLGELLLVDAHLILFLGQDQTPLDLLPGHGVQLIVWDLQGRVVKALDLPVLRNKMLKNIIFRHLTAGPEIQK